MMKVIWITGAAMSFIGLLAALNAQVLLEHEWILMFLPLLGIASMLYALFLGALSVYSALSDGQKKAALCIALPVFASSFVLSFDTVDVYERLYWSFYYLVGATLIASGLSAPLFFVFHERRVAVASE